MSLSLPMRRLLWKDMRQILPLVLLLIGISLVVHCLFVLSTSIRADEIQEMIRSMLIVIPMCYSIGAAAVSVSIEKENGQMAWLNGLPIDGYRVAASKLIAVFVGWLFVWCISLTIYEAMHVVRLGQAFNFPRYDYGLIGFTGALSVHIVQSFLMLAIGLMAAWRLQTAWIAIAAMFLIALIPFHAQAIYVLLVQNHRWLRNGSEVACTSIAAIFSVLFLMIGWRYARQYWSREIPRTPRSTPWTELIAFWLPDGLPDRTRLAFTRQDTARYSSNSALLWRTGQQHFAIFAVLFCVVLAALVAIFVLSHLNEKEYQILPLFSVIMAFVSCAVVSWAGWLVFRTDTQRCSIRFLAERGLSPTRLWWTQQVVSFAFLCVMALMILLAIRFLFPETHAWTWLSQGALRQFLFLLLIYSLSQWISFVLPKPVFAAIVAPFVGTILAIYLWIEAGFLYPNPWIASLLIAFPFIVTRVFFRSWMDGQRSWQYWARQAGCFVLFLCLPQIQHLAPLWNPAMPSTVRARMFAEASTLVKQPQTSVRFLQFDNLKPDPDHDYVEKVQANLRELFSTKDPYSKWEFSSETLPIVLGDIVNARVQIRELDTPTRFRSLKEPAAADSEAEAIAPNEKLKERYNESIGFLLKIVSLLRQSAKISDQDRSDWLEMFLLRELLQGDSESLLTQDSYNQIVDQLRDDDQRYQARRRAILLSWHKARMNPYASELNRTDQSRNLGHGPSLGGYSLAYDSRWSWGNPFFNTILLKVDYVTYEMLGCLEQGRQRTTDEAGSNRQHRSLAGQEIRRRIGAAWSETSEVHGLSDAVEANYFSPESPLHYAYDHESSHPSVLWYGEWERVGSRLEKR